MLVSQWEIEERELREQYNAPKPNGSNASSTVITASRSSSKGSERRQASVAAESGSLCEQSTAAATVAKFCAVELLVTLTGINIGRTKSRKGGLTTVVGGRGTALHNRFIEWNGALTTICRDMKSHIRP